MFGGPSSTLSQPPVFVPNCYAKQCEICYTGFGFSEDGQRLHMQMYHLLLMNHCSSIKIGRISIVDNT